jgi:hypothetical protein
MIKTEGNCLMSCKFEEDGTFPNRDYAEQMLEEAGQLNPGLWISHSRYAALAAQNIAQACPQLNSEKAYVLGLLHDIGRRYGITKMRHSLDGYRYCCENGFPDVGKICITHSFMNHDIREAFGEWDCTEEEYRFVSDYLLHTEYDDYDKLIQLCDALALPSGFCLMEKRMVDVVLRYTPNEFLVPKWKATFAIKSYFEDCMKQSIYDVLPDVVENTFRSE